MSGNPTKSKYWSALEKLRVKIHKNSTISLFENNPNRFEELSFSINGLLYDISKNQITKETIALLCDLAKEQGVEKSREKLFNGGIVNKTEHRAALHISLRDGSQDLKRLKEISDDLRNKKMGRVHR